MAEDDYRALLTEQGLPGWKAAVKFQDGHVAVLTPPGFDPAVSTAGTVTRRGVDEADAVAKAINYVKGSMQ